MAAAAMAPPQTCALRAGKSRAQRAGCYGMDPMTTTWQNHLSWCAAHQVRAEHEPRLLSPVRCALLTRDLAGCRRARPQCQRAPSSTAPGRRSGYRLSPRRQTSPARSRCRRAWWRKGSAQLLSAAPCPRSAARTPRSKQPTEVRAAPLCPRYRSSLCAAARNAAWTV